MKKIFSMILAALLLSSAFVSCSEPENSGGDDTADAAVTADETAPEEAETDSNVRLWEGKTFDGYTMHILGRQDAAFAIDFEAEELTGEIVNDAVYNRNIKAEDELDITLEYVPHIGDYSQFLQDVNNSVIAADGAYDLVSVYAYYGVSLALDNVLYNLHAVPNLTLGNSWFNQSFIEEMTLFDQLNFVVGDLTLTATDRMFMTFFNKDLAQDYIPGINLYDRVYEGGWTMDYMKELTSGIYTDENGNGERDQADIYGLVFDGNTSSIPADGLMAALRIHVTTKNTDGIPEITVYNDHVQSAYEKLVALTHDNPGAGVALWQADMFQQEKAVFVMYIANYAKYYLRDFESNYGVLPLPKYDEAQDAYYTTAQDEHNLVCIPKTCKNFEAVGAALDYLSCLSSETVYPAYFENTFQKKYMRSEEDSVMFDFIRSGMEFNFGAVFSNCIANPAHLFRVCINNQEPMASSYRTKEKTYVRKLENFLESLRELQAEQN